MARAWIRDNPPHWDEDRERIVGAASPGIFDFAKLKAGELLPCEWWRVVDGGRTVGFGWMETTWVDGEILLAVAADQRRAGIGTWILDQLEHEAGKAGFNYIHNVVRNEHPERAGIIRWLEQRGFVQEGDGRLRRRVQPG